MDGAFGWRQGGFLMTVAAVTVAAVLAGVLPGTAVAAPAASAPTPAAGTSAAVLRGGLTQPVYSYAAAVRETVWVEVPLDRDRDGRRDRVAADIVRPREPAAAGRRVPVILAASPYYRCCGRGNEGELKAYGPDGEPITFPLFYDNYFVPRGYAVVLVDLPSTGRSTGCLDVGGRSDVLSAKAVVDWLNGRAAGHGADGAPVRAGWASGAVGMIGKSWDGAIANGVAATGVAGLRTVVPISAVSNWYDYFRSHGQVLWGGNISALALMEIPWPEPGGPEHPCFARALRLDQEADDDTGDYTAFWAERDYRLAASRVRASVFLAHGLYDANTAMNQVQPWWAALGRAGVRRKLWLTQLGHVDPFDARRAEWVRTLHRWFDSELYGVRNGIRAEPPVTREAAPGVVVREAAWPAPAARRVRLALAGGPASGPDRLGRPPASASARRAFTDDPRQTEAQMVATPGVRSRGRLVFLTPPLARDVRLSGTAEVTLRATVDRPTTPLTALLVDYGPGRRIGPNEGIRTLETESCWGARTAADDGCYRDTARATRRTDVGVLTRGIADAAHHRSIFHRDPLRPGVEYTLRWTLQPQDVTVHRGHQLGLVLAGTDPEHMLADETSSATVSVRLAGSSVALPLVGGSSALRFAPVDRVPVPRPGQLPAPTAPTRRPH
jgi:X-Pro dipeptidyl-peptidase